MTKMISRHVY